MPIRVGMIGAGQIARSHALAYKTVPMLHGSMQDQSVILSYLAEANDSLARSASTKLGFETWTGNWKSLTRSSKVDLVDIITPTYLHAEPAIDAAEHQKHILCEKPLSTTAKQSRAMLDAATKAGVVHMVGFNYRKLHSVTFARELIAARRLGKIYRFKVGFLEDWGANPNLPMTWRYRLSTAGAGTLADLGSHALDMARFVLGDEIAAVCAAQNTFVSERKPPKGSRKNAEKTVDVDELTLALLKFRSGVIGTLETSWSATGRKVLLEFEVNGSEGSIYFNFERPNELMVYLAADEGDKQGYRTVLLGPEHPYGDSMVFPAHGMGMGFQESLVNEIYELLKAIRAKSRPKVSPSFYDGWMVNCLIEAIQESSRKEKWVHLQ